MIILPIIKFIPPHSEELGSLPPREALDALQHELNMYKTGLTDKRSIIAANKMDRPKSESNLALLRAHTGIPIIPVSAQLGRGVTDVTDHLRGIVEASRKQYRTPEMAHEEFMTDLFAGVKKKKKKSA